MALRLQPRLAPNARLAAAATLRLRERAATRVDSTIRRVRSLDALRGFDMLWIIGGDAVIESLAKFSPSTRVHGVLDQFTEHVPWAGLRFYDVIFPLFIVIRGAALPHSISGRLDVGDSRKAVLSKIFRRTALLFSLGLIYNGLFQFQGFDHLRIFGVLQRLALVYCATSVLMLFTNKKTLAVIGVGLLLVYWALLMAIPVPGFPLGTLSPTGNAANYLDRLMLTPHQMYKSYGDPEGLLSTIPAVATCILGAMAGYWLQSDRPESRKAIGLGIGGLVCVAVGIAWMPLFPVIKALWTSSFVLVSGGVSLLLLAAFYWVIDVRGWTKWAIPLVVIGMNPLLIYLLVEVVDFEQIAGYFLNGPLRHFASYQDLAIAVGSLSVKWLLLYFLYRQRIFVKV